MAQSEQNLSILEMWTSLKYSFLGFLLAEFCYLILAVGKLVYNRLWVSAILGNTGQVIILHILFVLLASVIALFVPYVLPAATRILKSKRFDVYIAFILGFAIDICFSGFIREPFASAMAGLSSFQLLLILSVPFIALLAQCLRRRKSESPSSLFLNDDPKASRTEDLLNFSGKADRFAESVFNNGSSKSMVFAIDAPWGVGKTTFWNLCKEHWKKKYANTTIVCEFSPINYGSDANLMQVFVDELIRSIRSEIFAPELRPLVRKYSRFVNAKVSLSALGVVITSGTYTIDHAFKDLENYLKTLRVKVIVLIDDLDRLSFSEIKQVLFGIRKIFKLPNISYVLCYNTCNLQSKAGDDINDVIEFLEKFVDLKTSIYINTQQLVDYVRSLEKELPHVSPEHVRNAKSAIKALDTIFSSTEYHRYVPFVSDLRKLKKLVNSVLLLDIHKADMLNIDIDPYDLLHLMLINLIYPSVFHKIYATETQGKNGFFSCSTSFQRFVSGRLSAEKYDSNDDTRYTNSSEYGDYVKELTPSQRLLVEKVFDVNVRLKTAQGEILDGAAKRSYACFNEGSAETRNLERYLKLIVDTAQPPKESQYKYYANLKKEIVNGAEVKSILTREESSFSNSEDSYEQFWRVLTNSAHEFDHRTGAHVINYLLEHIKDYSTIRFSDITVGLRGSLSYYLVKLLDSAGWIDYEGGHAQNTDESVAEIADWIFGEKDHEGRGIVETLGSEGRGLLGLHDLLSFRLRCSADRGGDIFNLQRALAKHGNPSAPTDGLVIEIAKEEMREISQGVFALFEEQYISAGKNIFELAEKLLPRDLTGKYFSAASSYKPRDREMTLDEAVHIAQTSIMSFVAFQLSNAQTAEGAGIGCGYYDPTGSEDNGGIRVEVIKYFFDVCFDPDTCDKAYEYFLNYLLSHLSGKPGTGGKMRYGPEITEFTSLLGEDNLKEYWLKHRDTIMKKNLREKDVSLRTVNYIANYRDDLEPLFEELNKLLPEPKRTSPPTQQ